MDTTLRDGSRPRLLYPAKRPMWLRPFEQTWVDRIEIASTRVSEGEMDGVMRTTSGQQ